MFLLVQNVFILSQSQHLRLKIKHLVKSVLRRICKKYKYLKFKQTIGTSTYQKLLKYCLKNYENSCSRSRLLLRCKYLKRYIFLTLASVLFLI